MIIDEATIIIKAGNGGDGAVSFKRNAQTAKGGPDGGNGGNGGDVFIEGSTNVTDLREFQFKKKIAAEDGIGGGKNKLFGRNGKDITILLPVGTTLTDIDTEIQVSIEKKGQKIRIAKGGKGGRGNTEFKSAIEQTPRFSEKGEKGEEKRIQLIMRLIADIGLVGLPNAGKSTLLSLLTNAKPKIGNYPFTTLDPYLGMVESVIIADIPGVIEGASKGKGLGIKFLKHIEKTKVLFYCIASDDQNPFQTYTMLRNEFAQYDKRLLEKSEFIVLTKSDLVSEEELKAKKAAFEGKTVITISQYDKASIIRLAEVIRGSI